MSDNSYFRILRIVFGAVILVDWLLLESVSLIRIYQTFPFTSFLSNCLAVLILVTAFIWIWPWGKK